MVANAVGDVQSVLLLGATSDIGQAIARALVARGARRVVLAGRDETVCKALGERLGPAVETHALAFDADATDTHEKFLDSVFALGFDIDAVVVAFGIQPTQEQVDADPDLAVAMARTNYLGAVSALLRLAPRLRRQGHGRIVVLSSVAGERARSSNYAYGSTKAGLDALSQGLGDALVGSGVSVMVVRPGFVRTKLTAAMTPAPLSVDPDAVAAAVVRGLRRGSEVVWVPDLLRWVMVLLRHLPRAVFRRLPI